MKQAIAIFLVLVYTCNGTTLQQLQKAPVLVEHYLEHQAIVEDISISEFLILHYLSGNPKDADYDRDMQLPFKTMDFVASANTPAYIPTFFPELTFSPSVSPWFTKEFLMNTYDLRNTFQVSGNRQSPADLLSALLHVLYKIAVA